jgi:hypothetical protein
LIENIVPNFGSGFFFLRKPYILHSASLLRSVQQQTQIEHNLDAVYTANLAHKAVGQIAQ